MESSVEGREEAVVFAICGFVVFIYPSHFQKGYDFEGRQLGLLVLNFAIPHIFLLYRTDDFLDLLLGAPVLFVY